MRQVRTASCVPSALRHKSSTASLSTSRYQTVTVSFRARCNIYISRLCYDVSVRLSVHLSVCLWDGSALAHYSEFRFQIPIPIYRALRSRCMRARGKGSSPGRGEGSSRAMLATARPSCFYFPLVLSTARCSLSTVELCRVRVGQSEQDNYSE